MHSLWQNKLLIYGSKKFAIFDRFFILLKKEVNCKNEGDSFRPESNFLVGNTRIRL